MNFKPHGCRVLIKPDKPEEKTKSGLWIPEMARDAHGQQQKYGMGTVVSMGPGMLIEKDGTRRPMPNGDTEVLPDVHGKRVLYFTGAAQKIVLEDVEYHVVRDESIDAFFDDELSGESLARELADSDQPAEHGGE